MKRWSPAVELTRQEQQIMKRLRRVRALFSYLRLHRHELFDDDFQAELEAMYRDTGAGAPPVPPAMMCMATIIQGYMGTSDAEAVELTVVDLRWQMVLGCLGATEPAFSQGALSSFRQRMTANDMDRRLLERTAEIGLRDPENKDISRGAQALKKALKVAIDSRPLLGAGRVEDTINLLGHSARLIVRFVAQTVDQPEDVICDLAGIPLLKGKSIKAGLDINWSDKHQKATAIDLVDRQVSSLHEWVELNFDAWEAPELQAQFSAIAQVREQDLEQDEHGTTRISRGVAHDRRISIEDSEMRHGRKSKSKRFDGYKEHVATDLTTGVVVACSVTPANVPEEEGAAPIADDILRQGFAISELHIDRAYVNSAVVDDVCDAGGQVFSKPWSIRNSNPGMFTKMNFSINTRAQTVTCPGGEVEVYEPGNTVHFDAEACGGCALRANCTRAESGRGRTISIGRNEARQKGFRKLQDTKAGREKLRERVGVEHALAHIAARKGPRARYIGIRKNVHDLRRAASIRNLEVAHLRERRGAIADTQHAEAA